MNSVEESAQMAQDDPKLLVSKFFERLSSTMYEDAFALTDVENGIIHLPSPRQDITIGEWKAVYLRLMETMFPSGLPYTIRVLTREDNRVAALVDGIGKMKTGGTYHNQYHFLMVIDGGRIVEIFEYLDSWYAQRTIHQAGWKGREG
jgi:ketosteroid isomerase-like protein